MKGSKVRVGGFDAGEVTDIKLPDSPAAHFRLTLSVVERVHGLIRPDSLVSVASEGIVGDKLLQIHPGSANLPQAAPNSTLRSKEALEMSELLERSAGLLNDVSGTMKEVSTKLTGTLDAATTTVNNANDLVVGIKQGKGRLDYCSETRTPREACGRRSRMCSKPRPQFPTPPCEQIV